MCETNKRFFLVLLFFFLLAGAVGALRAEEPGPWYLISETELRSIEEYLVKSEQEKQSWLSQANGLRIRAEKSEADSSLLNNQLLTARETNRRLETSFNEYEAGQLMLVSSKNGEIANLKEEIAERALETEKYRGTAWSRLIIIIALCAAWIILIAFKALRFFRLI